MICALPTQALYPAGVNVHRIRPLFASSASVLPYVVLTTMTLRTAPATFAACR